MSFVENCEECQRLSAAYEAVTIEWFRLQGQLRVAEYSRDSEAARRIAAELQAIGKRRETLRDETEKHQLAAHHRTTTASNGALNC